MDDSCSSKIEQPPVKELCKQERRIILKYVKYELGCTILALFVQGLQILLFNIKSNQSRSLMQSIGGSILLLLSVFGIFFIYFIKSVPLHRGSNQIIILCLIFQIILVENFSENSTDNFCWSLLLHFYLIGLMLKLAGIPGGAKPLLCLCIGVYTTIRIQFASKFSLTTLFLPICIYLALFLHYYEKYQRSGQSREVEDEEIAREFQQKDESKHLNIKSPLVDNTKNQFLVVQQRHLQSQQSQLLQQQQMLNEEHKESIKTTNQNRQTTTQQDSGDFYHQLLSLMPKGLALLNCRFQLYYANKAIMKILQCNQSNLTEILLSLSNSNREVQGGDWGKGSNNNNYNKNQQMRNNSNQPSVKSQLSSKRIGLNKIEEEQIREVYDYSVEERSNVGKSQTDRQFFESNKLIENSNNNENQLEEQDIVQHVSPQTNYKYDSNFLNTPRSQTAQLEDQNNIFQIQQQSSSQQQQQQQLTQAKQQQQMYIQDKLSCSELMQDQNSIFQLPSLMNQALVVNQPQSQQLPQQQQSQLQNSQLSPPYPQSNEKKQTQPQVYQPGVSPSNFNLKNLSIVNINQGLNNGGTNGNNLIGLNGRQVDPFIETKVEQIIQNLFNGKVDHQVNIKPLQDWHGDQSQQFLQNFSNNNIEQNNNNQTILMQGVQPQTMDMQASLSMHNPYKKQQSFFDQINSSRSIGFVQVKNNIIEMAVQNKGQQLCLQFLPCEFSYQETGSELCVLVMIEPLWTEMYSLKAEEAIKKKMKIFQSLSHELRTPLNCSIGMLEVLQDLIKQKTIVSEFIEPALFSNKLLLDRVNDMLDSVQLSSGKFKFSYTDFNLEQLLRECLTMFKIQASKKNLTLKLKVSPAIPKIFNSDPNRIRQIVLNFLSNSLKFTKNGFIELSAALSNPEPSIQRMPEADSSNVYEKGAGTGGSQNLINPQILPDIASTGSILIHDIVTLAVEDSGIGMTQEEMNKIFQAFNKVDLGDDQGLNQQGCGLGMILSNTLSKQLGPQEDAGITVRSEKDRGSVFEFKLFNRNARPQPGIPSSCNICLTEEAISECFINGQAQSNKFPDKQRYFTHLEEQSVQFQGKKINYLINQKKQLKINQRGAFNIEKELKSSYSEGRCNSIKLQYTLNDMDDSKLIYQLHSMPNNGSSAYRTQQQGSEILNQLGSSNGAFSNENCVQCNCPKILIVDDEEFNILAFQQLLQLYQIKADSADSGEAALLKVQSRFANHCCQTYELIFMDIEMQQKDGYATSADIRLLYKNKSLMMVPRIVACTGYQKTLVDQKAKSAGIQDFLSKPIFKKPLEQILKKYKILI